MYHPTLNGREQTSAPKNSLAWKSSATTNLQENPFQTTHPDPKKRLSDKHYDHCCGNDISQKERGLNPDWIAANCYSVSEQQATELLAYKALSGGIVIQGSNGQYQFRPDRPWSDKQVRNAPQPGNCRQTAVGSGEKKAPKYRTAAGDEYDALLPAHPTDKHYWHNLEQLKQQCWHIDGHPYLLVTEGGFKAICACSHNLPTVALLGVEMGLTSAKADPQGKRYLVPALERLAIAGFGFILSFDADITTKPAVKRALYKLGFQLKKFNVPVYVLPPWDEELGKGIDDYIQLNGIEEFRQKLLAKAIRFENWQKDYETDNTQPKIPDGYPKSWNANNLADWLINRYKEKLAWDVPIQEWRRYSAEIEGIWSIEPTEFVRQVIHAELNAAQPIYTKVKEGKIYEPPITDSLIKNIESLMKYNLAVRQWDETERLLPLFNGILNLDTYEQIPHNPRHRLTWCLPYKYNPLATCDPIKQWLGEMCQGDENLVQLLRAYLHGLVTGRTDWQKYLELIGPGGTGKSTYIRLAIALVGQRNVHTTTLKKLENERFETASLKDKRLVVITDSERYTGNVSILKALTGEDTLPYEVKFKQSTGGFTPTAMVIVAANEIIQSGDYTSGLERRRMTVPMSHRIEAPQQRNLLTHRKGLLQGELAPYIPGLLNWVLGMNSNEATALVKNYQHRVPRLAGMKAQSLVETNPIADWLDYAIVYRDGHRTAVGVAKRDKNPQSENWYCHVNQWLYANYSEYCHNTGAKAIGVRRFVNLLDDLCVNQLKLSVKHGRDRQGAYFLGLKIRTEGDLDPLLITGDSDPPPPPPDSGGWPRPKLSPYSPPDAVTDVMASVTDSVMAQTRSGDGCDGCDGFLENLRKRENSHSQSVSDVNSEQAINNGFVPSHPSLEITKTFDGDESQPICHPSPMPSPNHHRGGINPSHKVAQNPVPRSAQIVSTPDGDELQANSSVPQVDYSTYPHRTSNDIRAKEKRANKCLELMLACTTQEELARFRSESGFSNTEINWVYHHALTPSEQQKVKEAAVADQLNLLSQPVIEWNDLMAAIDSELSRLGWTTKQAQDYISSSYGVKSRHQLSDEQVIEFWESLKAQ